MIVKQRSTETSLPNSTRSFRVIGTVLLLAVLAIVFKLWVALPSWDQGEVITCGAEEIKLEGTRSFFFEDGRKFENGHTQTDEQARTGDYSSVMGKGQEFGILYRFDEAEGDSLYKASVWRYGNKQVFSYLVASSEGENRIYRTAETASRYDENGWEYVELYFRPPLGHKDLKIYVTKSGPDKIYFDDFKIEKVPSRSLLAIERMDSSFQHLDLRLDYKARQKIETKRQQAIGDGILFNQDDDWVKGDLVSDEGKIPVKARLKGDWMDHLQGDKWSFRISTRQQRSWNRLMTFSVQSPYTRHHLSEWVYHQMLTREGVLTTRYDFITFSLNGDPKGVYVYEEHFEKQLPEFKHRREGPILKFAEDGVWNARLRMLTTDVKNPSIEYDLQTFEASQIAPFKASRTLKDSSLAAQYQIAQTLLQQYKLGQKPVSEVFDLERLAKFYAIADVNQAYHNMAWHNMRFYYNPVISRLEPIGFDGFNHTGRFNYRNKVMIGSEIATKTGIFHDDFAMHPFLDEAFMERYHYYLDQYSQKSYLETFWFEIEAALKKRKALLLQEFPDYQYIYRPAGYGEKIQATLFPLNDNSIKANVQDKKGGMQNVVVSSFHFLPLRILGFGDAPKTLSYPLDESFYLPAQERGALPELKTLKAPLNAKYLLFELPGIDSIFYSELTPWSQPMVPVPAQGLFSQAKPHNNAVYKVEGNTLFFGPGRHQVDSLIVVPEGYQLYFAAGCEIDFIKRGGLISRSPVKALGTEDEPIRIISSDGNSQGFTILQAPGRSALQNVHFEGHNTLSEQGWKLTGGVTFYESDVAIDHCAFVRNHCEDALNLVRCKFNMNACLVSHTFADGFDADFCQGEINSSIFSHTGNDCMDFSGSLITVKESKVLNSGDKGVSVGEEANVTIQSLEVDGAVIGVASKDLSQLTIDHIILRNVDKGFTAYQKKPEYGGGTIIVRDYEAENVKYLHLIEKGSRLELKGQEVEGI